MKIQLVQAEIEEALHDYIQKQGISLKDKTMSIAFTAGRGNNGMTADLDIEPVRLVGAACGNSPVALYGETMSVSMTRKDLEAAMAASFEPEERCAEGPATIAGEDVEKAAEEATSPEGKKESASLFG